MKNINPLTYLNFSDELHYLKKETDIEDVSKLYQKMNQLQIDPYFLGDHLFFIVDYTKRKYSVISGPFLQTISYHTKDFLDGGLDFLVEILQKDDFSVINKKIFSSTANFFSNEPYEEHSKYIFEMNYRVHDKKGNALSIIQKGSYITDAVTKLPLYGFGICMNISSLKKDTSMVHQINKYQAGQKGNQYQHISTDYFYPAPEEALLSKREIEILKWMADGISTKQIMLSHNTIANHRKNMLRKANAKNVAELISSAIKNNII